MRCASCIEVDVSYALFTSILVYDEKSQMVIIFVHKSLSTFVAQVYELDGNVHDSRWVLEAYINTTKQFVHDHPDFTGAKFIYAAVR